MLLTANALKMRKIVGNSYLLRAAAKSSNLRASPESKQIVASTMIREPPLLPDQS